MISAEYDRLVQALIAGRLSEAEKEELFRLAAGDRELAEVLRGQELLNAGIGADRAGLTARFSGGGSDALRAHVAALSAKTLPQTVQPEGTIGGLSGAFSGLTKWIVALAVTGVVSLGIVLSRGDSSPVQASEDPSPSKIVLPSTTPPLSVTENRGEEKGREESKAEVKRESGEGEANQLRTEEKVENSREDSPNALAPIDSIHATKKAIKHQNKDEIPFQGGVDSTP